MREKIIEALEVCSERECPDCTFCPYNFRCKPDLAIDVLELVRPVEYKRNHKRDRICPKCNTVLKGPFCHECGQPVIWDSIEQITKEGK